MLYGTAPTSPGVRYSTLMRTDVASLVASCAVVVLGAAPAVAAAPSLRVVPGSMRTIQGAGFVPRTIVRLRLTVTGSVLRLVLVRAGAGGGFSVTLPPPPTCGVIVVNATGVRDRHARVATDFGRRCPPPPPIRAPDS